MKLIIAIIRPEKLEAVEAALHERKACLMSVSQVLSDGREPGWTAIYRGAEFHVQPPKLRLEITVDDWLVEAVIEAIIHAGSTGHSGQIGDYRVCVMPLDEYIASTMAKESIKDLGIRLPAAPPRVGDLNASVGRPY
jgi:nitrogen regulatory protein P-II 2